MEQKIARIRGIKVFEECIQGRLCDWLLYIGAKSENLDSLLIKIKEIFLQKISIYEAEETLHKLIWSIGIKDVIEGRLRIEEDLVFGEIRPYLVKGTLLDIGTGSGLIAQKGNDAGFLATIIDVIDFNKSNLKLTLYDGKKIPFPDNKFTNVTLLTVLHHCNCWTDVLAEAIRVSNKNIVIIESVHTDQKEYYSNMFFDWLWNRVVYRDVNVPFNFHKPREWEEIFIGKGLKIDKTTDLGYDSPMTPEHHWLFVLKK
jgi:2-polyprenyl-3-methyl-5-hydroxy-6-metoxy-1,4-benzoquinol methylase